jgi:hypothetical protein
MFSEFILYLQTGLKHILDPKGYDHILFVIALCAIYRISDWQKLLWLVTAFTLGHSITLALATLKIIRIHSEIIEFLIPITIIFTCIANFFYQSSGNYAQDKENKRKDILRYVTTLFFGLIHGLGFSNFLISLLGRQANIGFPLFAFNIGLEIGQLVIVAILLTVITILSTLNIRQREWILVISSIVFGVTLTLVQEKWIF